MQRTPEKARETAKDVDVIMEHTDASKGFTRYTSYLAKHHQHLLKRVKPFIGARSDIVLALFIGLLGLARWDLALIIVAEISIGVVQVRLSEIYHQATHRTLFQTELLNLIAGRSSGWSLGRSLTAFEKTHAGHGTKGTLGHHVNLGHETRDPEFIALKEDCSGFFTAKTRTELVDYVWDYIWNIFNPKRMLDNAPSLFKGMVNPEHEDVQERMWRLSSTVLVIALLAYYGHLVTFVMFWMLPMATVCNALLMVRDLGEHMPMFSIGARWDIFLTRNRIFHWTVDWLFCFHKDGYHLVHHLWPMIPNHHLKEVHDILMTESLYRAAHEKLTNGASVTNPMSAMDYFSVCADPTADMAYWDPILKIAKTTKTTKQTNEILFAEGNEEDALSIEE